MRTYQKIVKWFLKYRFFLIILFILFFIFNLYLKKYMFEYFEYFENSQVQYKVIHMKGKQDRLDNIKKQEKTAGIDIDIFDAVVGANLDIPQLQKDGMIQSNWNTHRYRSANTKKGKKHVMSGEIGCYMSHLNLLKDIYESDFDGWTVIFEDDLLINKDFKTEINKILQNIDENIDFIYIGSLNQDNCNRGVFKDNLCYIDNPWGTHAYMVNKRSAKKIYKLIKFIDREIDIKYRDLIHENKINGLIVIPTLVRQNNETTISVINEHYISFPK